MKNGLNNQTPGGGIPTGLVGPNKVIKTGVK